MRKFFTGFDIASRAEEVNVTDESPDCVREARVVNVRCVIPEAITKFRIGIWRLREQVQRSSGNGKAVQLADLLNAEAILPLAQRLNMA